jgi:Zn-dependent protease with chaperone function
MSAGAESVMLFMLAATAFLLVGSAISALLARSMRARLALWEPAVRHRVLVVLALTPALIALALLCSASLPSLEALFVPSLDHCLTHDDGHAHLCFVHLPSGHTRLPAVAVVVFIGSYALLRGALEWAGLQRAARVLRTLAATGTHQALRNMTIIETATPFCVAAGVLKPTVLISRGLLKSLDIRDQTIVLEHEHAHVQRSDALVAAVVRAFSSLHIPSVARWIQRELEIAAEQACDERAALAVEDRIAVAEAILTVARALQSDPSRELGIVALAFGESAVERRVEALLREPLASISLRPLGIAATFVLVGLVAVSERLHHATESLLAALAR